MDRDYEDIVRDYYIRNRDRFLRRLTAKYSTLSLYEAENLYQDTFLAIRENLLQGRIKEDTSWSSYIITIGLNLANKLMQKKGIIVSIDEGYDEENDFPTKTARTVDSLLNTLQDDETPLYQNLEAQALLGDELKHTPEPCHSIIRLFYYKDKSMAYIADEVGYKNATTVKSKKNQCMKDLIRRVTKALRDVGIIDEY